jgi:hypothetical protein
MHLAAWLAVPTEKIKFVTSDIANNIVCYPTPLPGEIPTFIPI